MGQGLNELRVKESSLNIFSKKENRNMSERRREKMRRKKTGRCQKEEDKK